MSSLAKTMRQRAIIIGGCGRSGTTLLSTLLSAHPSIYLVSEDGQDRETHALCCDLHADDSSLERIRSRIDWLPARITSWCEKTPANIHFARSTLDYFIDRARFLNIVRDGRDVVTSVHPNAPNRFAIAPSRWVRDVRAADSLEADSRFMTIRYEELVGDPKTVLHAVCAFIREPFDEAMLGYPATAKVQRSGAWFEDATEIHGRAVGRWREERFRGAVEQLLKEPGARELLERYGYLP